MTKKELLTYLKENQHTYVSGEEIASHFGVTRAGVWKHIKKLQDEGVRIEGVTNKGYKLLETFLSERAILSKLDGTDFGKYKFEKIICETFESIPSTNTHAKTNPQSGLHIICATEQTAGRGRKGNSFYSPKDTGVYFSIAFAPQLEEANIFTVACAVAVCEALAKLSGKNTQIKWVNDIYLEKKKVCGILTEGTFDFETSSLSQSIEGIGINLQTTDFPDEISQKAGALGLACDQNTLISEIIKSFFACLTLENEKLIEKYTAHSLVLGKEVTFPQNGETIKATAIKFNNEGNLVCQNEEETFVLKAGEISIRGFI